MVLIYLAIHPDFVKDIETPVNLGRVRRIATASKAYIEVTQVVRSDFYINDVLLSDEFLVVPVLSEEAIIGSATYKSGELN